jgi:uncharacterized protein (TIGR02217 family)
MSFHEVLFPTAIALGATGGPERRTEIVQLASGFEERNALWAHARRRWNAGLGVKTVDDLHAVIAFFEARMGRLYGFRYRDKSDYKSCTPGAAHQPTDQTIGTGDGLTARFQLTKTYSSGGASTVRLIRKPVAGQVRCALGGVETGAFTLDAATGLVTFAAPPALGVSITAGFQFDCPVRFDTDKLEINLAYFEAGEVPEIPIVEIRV